MTSSAAGKPPRRRWLRCFATIIGFCLVATALLLALITQPLVQSIPVPGTPRSVDKGQLKRHVRMLSESLHPRSYDDPENLAATADYIESAFAAAGAQTKSQAVSVQGMQFRNVIAHFGPDSGPLLVIGAHYDACRISDRAPGATPGADDNASGVAALLELARLLQQHPPSRSVQLVAYTLEEPPFFRTPDMGSAWHARLLRKSGREVQLMLSLETIGYYSDIPGSQHYPLPGMQRLYGDRGDFVALVGRLGDFGATRRAKALMSGAASVPVRTINAPPLVEGIDFSDHRSYWAQDYPALMVTDTAFLRNPHYHRPTDIIDNLDFDRMAEVVQGVYAITQSF